MLCLDSTYHLSIKHHTLFYELIVLHFLHVCIQNVAMVTNQFLAKFSYVSVIGFHGKTDSFTPLFVPYKPTAKAAGTTEYTLKYLCFGSMH